MEKSLPQTLLEELKKTYPDVLKMEPFSGKHIAYLIPYLLEHGATYKRADIVQLANKCHEEITGVKDNRSVEQLGRSAKRFFATEPTLEKFEKYKGFYKFVGDSALDRLSMDPSALQAELEQSEKVTINNIQKGEQGIGVHPLREITAIAPGDEVLYVWWHSDSEKLAGYEQEAVWAMKVGIHHKRTVADRFRDYKVAIPHEPILGLLVYCKKASVLEKTVHRTLTNRQQGVGEMGSEWFITSVNEVVEILEFNHLVSKDI